MRAKIFLLSSLLVAVLAVSGCTSSEMLGMKDPGTFVRAPSCTWVFKMKADYSDQIAVSLSQDKSRVTNVPFFRDSIEELAQGYYAAVSGCEYPEDLVIAFSNVTVDEWESSQEECWEQRAAEAAEIETQKETRDTGQDMFPRQIQTEDRFCDSELFLEIMLNFQDYLTDDDPFTEIYICDAPAKNAQELNSIISRGELESRCKRWV
jgi:hypothetical protein